jgi:DNA-binding transcriptional ArsR family regulator
MLWERLDMRAAAGCAKSVDTRRGGPTLSCITAGEKVRSSTTHSLFNQVVDFELTASLWLLSTNWLNIGFDSREAALADQLSKVFAALADPTRRDMVARLSVADATVNELAEPYEVSVQAVSKHLKVLEESGLVSRTRDAQRRPVHLEDNVFDLMTKWIERYRQQAEERYQRLDAVLEAMDADEETHDSDSAATSARESGTSSTDSTGTTSPGSTHARSRKGA